MSPGRSDVWPSYRQTPRSSAECDPRHMHRGPAGAREIEAQLASWQVGKEGLDFRAICKDMEEFRETFWLREQPVQKLESEACVHRVARGEI